MILPAAGKGTENWLGQCMYAHNARSVIYSRANRGVRRQERTEAHSLPFSFRFFLGNFSLRFWRDIFLSTEWGNLFFPFISRHIFLFLSFALLEQCPCVCNDPNLIRFDVSVFTVLVPGSIASTHSTRCNIKNKPHVIILLPLSQFTGRVRTSRSSIWPT